MSAVDEAREALLLALRIGRVSFDGDPWYASGGGSPDRITDTDAAEAAFAAADPDALIAAVRAEYEPLLDAIRAYLAVDDFDGPLDHIWQDRAAEARVVLDAALEQRP